MKKRSEKNETDIGWEICTKSEIYEVYWGRLHVMNMKWAREKRERELWIHATEVHKEIDDIGRFWGTSAFGGGGCRIA